MDTIATTINGHSATTQKERLQSGFSGVGFLFMLLSQAFEDRYFRKFEIFLPMLGATTTTAGAIQVRLRLRLEKTRRGGALDQRFETRIAWKLLTVDLCLANDKGRWNPVNKGLLGHALPFITTQ